MMSVVTTDDVKGYLPPVKILVVGSGAREHALVWKLLQENEVYAAPGNPGIEAICECFPVSAANFEGLGLLARRLEVNLIVVGPEDPLIAGLADFLRDQGFSVYGPGAAGAQLEGSKAFSKDLMKTAGVPTAQYGNFRDASEAKTFAAEREAAGKHVVIKASGAALGKGVTVCNSLREAEDAIDFALLARGFGDAGTEIVVEDRLDGREFSLLTLCSDQEFLSLPVAQDYKRIHDNDEGPNTGGMGSYSPVPWIPQGLVAQVEATCVKPLLDALHAQGIQFRGTLFSGIMVENGVPYCLEYNVRFGDPETQSVMARLGTGLAQALLACANGGPIPSIGVKDNSVVSVVVASGGYPGDYQKGVSIAITELPENVTAFHAGTKQVRSNLVTNGGRVITLTATASSLAEARSLSYEGVKCVCFDGMQFRTDIAAETAAVK